MTATNLAEQPFNHKPIGTGPFQVEEFGSGEAGQPPHILLSAFSSYYDRQPYIAKIDFKFYPDFPSMLAAYHAGEIQGLSKVPVDQLTSVRDTPSLNLYTGPLAGYTMIFLNQGDAALPFFQDQNVRQALLLSLDRRQIVEEVLRPRLAAGQVVLCDRYYDSTLAYQGYGHQVIPLDELRQIIRFATGGLTPDLTVLLDLDVELGLARKGKQDEWNRLDAYTLEFHRRVRAGYHELVALEPGRWVVVDAGQDWESVQASLRKVIGARLK